jgi:hypothetical protein
MGLGVRTLEVIEQNEVGSVSARVVARVHLCPCLCGRISRILHANARVKRGFASSIDYHYYREGLVGLSCSLLSFCVRFKESV